MSTKETFRKNLKQVGLVLIVIGLLDICWMIYCITNEISYSSSFNIFAVIAGIFLYRGGPKTARLVAFFSAFFLSVFSWIILGFLLSTPLDLVWVELKLETLSYLGIYVFGFLAIGILFWIYKRLTRPEVLAAIQADPGTPKSRFRNPRAGFIYGSILAVFLGIVLFFYSQGSMKDEAIKRAKAQVGPNYKFHISGFNVRSSGGMTHYEVSVTAYNNHEIKVIPESWDD